MNISEQLLEIQSNLKVPKGQYNSFGKYNYRSCEDILEAAKPLLLKAGLTLTLDDKVEQVGSHAYIQATATLTNSEKQTISNHGYAREAETKKGMDDSQITGTTSSYARKYALNGLFLIDDTKDADSDEYQRQLDKAKGTTGKQQGQSSNPPQNTAQPPRKRMTRAEAITEINEVLFTKYADKAPEMCMPITGYKNAKDIPVSELGVALKKVKAAQ
jgi:hypothetical protein